MGRDTIGTRSTLGGTLDGTKALGGISGDREECFMGTLRGQGGKVGGDKEGHGKDTQRNFRGQGETWGGTSGD